ASEVGGQSRHRCPQLPLAAGGIIPGPYDQELGRERADLARDPLPVGTGTTERRGGAWSRLPGQRVAAGDANAFESEVESEDGVGADHATGVPAKLRFLSGGECPPITRRAISRGGSGMAGLGVHSL